MVINNDLAIKRHIFGACSSVDKQNSLGRVSARAWTARYLMNPFLIDNAQHNRPKFGRAPLRGWLLSRRRSFWWRISLTLSLSSVLRP